MACEKCVNCLFSRCDNKKNTYVVANGERSCLNNPVPSLIEGVQTNFKAEMNTV